MNSTSRARNSPDGAPDIVAVERDVCGSGGRLAALRRMHAEIGLGGIEDQPAAAHVRSGKAQLVAQKSAQCFGLGRIEHRMHPANHGDARVVEGVAALSMLMNRSSAVRCSRLMKDSFEPVSFRVQQERCVIPRMIVSKAGGASPAEAYRVRMLVRNRCAKCRHHREVERSGVIQRAHGDRNVIDELHGPDYATGSASARSYKARSFDEKQQKTTSSMAASAPTDERTVDTAMGAASSIG